MGSPDEKGKFSTSISQDLIDQALRSVEKHSGRPDVDHESVTDPDIPLPPLAGDEVPIAVESEGDAPAIQALAAELRELRSQLDLSQEKGRETMDRLKEEHERVLRATADLDNYRKRAVKEKDEVLKYGTERLLRDFLPILDNLERALEHAVAPSDFESLLKGVSMIRKMLEDAFTRHGVKPVQALGQPFDPRFHEAMQQEERSDVPPSQVIREVVRGFSLNDRLIRPALVVVSKASPRVEGPPAEAVQTPGLPASEPDDPGGQGGAGASNAYRGGTVVHG